MVARALGVSSPIGKELDSLADVVTFGVAPSAMLFSLFQEVQYPDFMEPVRNFMPYTAFIMAAFSALRLAKFNLDTRQTSSFIGLPTPANALFWGSLIVGQHAFLVSGRFNALFLFLFIFIYLCLDNYKRPDLAVGSVFVYSYIIIKKAFLLLTFKTFSAIISKVEI